MHSLGSFLSAVLLGGSLSLAAQPEPLKTPPALLDSSPAPAIPGVLPPAGPAMVLPDQAPAAGHHSPALPPEMIEGPPPPQCRGLVPWMARSLSQPGPEPEGAKLKRLLYWFCYRPKELVRPRELCQAYNPRPPLYLYFFYPQPFEGPGQRYPYGPTSQCWSPSCSAGVPAVP